MDGVVVLYKNKMKLTTLINNVKKKEKAFHTTKKKTQTFAHVHDDGRAGLAIWHAGPMPGGLAFLGTDAVLLNYFSPFNYSLEPPWHNWIDRALIAELLIGLVVTPLSPEQPPLHSMLSFKIYCTGTCLLNPCC